MMSAMKTILRRPDGLCGERGLLAAIIAQATDDAIGAGGPKYVGDAWQYFAGDLYRTDLELLDLPADWLPEALFIKE